ncbi:hypothetical protein KDD17_17525 [Sulfitobacter albidus]|uniref:Vanadium-dependent haloperoxidase n=1 Tax=Sulfitobacter albidus TaxID=2829501 RepID=A0A975JGK3_9RHOB|nr:hypothetical protein [Sulfitobacter albidus]QUJ78142.1 hypothetical protein KDD17_17525 [Sulfitobacter albidus]
MKDHCPYSQPTPSPDARAHVAEGHARRAQAADHAATPLVSAHNGEAEDFAQSWPTNFTKGLPHDCYGNVDPTAYATFFREVARPTYTSPNGQRRAAFDVPRYTGSFRTAPTRGETPFDWRGWESPLAGHQFTLEGPGPAAVGMAPAPRLGSDELAGEMAELYAMAHLRDLSFEDMRDGAGDAGVVTDALCKLPWFQPGGDARDADGAPLDPVSTARRARDGGPLCTQTLFRGSSPGCAAGPYLSQFILQGHDSRGGGRAQMEAVQQIHGRARRSDGTRISARDGMILFGAQRIDQRIEPQTPGVDYLRDWAEWLDVQNGANTKNEQAFDPDIPLKFIETPRDLASYVHFDALYQAYLNACLLMLSWGTPMDPGLPEPNTSLSRTPFATWGGPHILTLVTEVATRALRAVRRQKFQIHNRARPEKLGQVASLVANGHGDTLGLASDPAQAHLEKLGAAKHHDFDLLHAIAQADESPQFAQSEGAWGGLPDNGCNLLLPMAYPEGSPMHPSYGAGHATVAGACVTVLKAFFATRATDGSALTLEQAGAPAVFVPAPGGLALSECTRQGDTTQALTLEGELNKLAANISIGRNMAGVHFYSDYFDSLRLGERIAVGILAEQMVTYTEGVTLSLDSFDGDALKIHGDGLGGFGVDVAGGDYDSWRLRHVPQSPAGV